MTILPDQRQRRRSSVKRLAAWALAAAAALWLAGFLSFLLTGPKQDLAAGAPADGIVVLTGGQDRIAEAVELLAAGRGRRLLISGVNTMVTDDALARQFPKSAALFQCCIDIGHRALNTAGNAQEAGAWAARHGHKTLIVVTSDYHMPRAMIEFRRAMPSVDLRAWAVAPVMPETSDWQQRLARSRLLAMEYSKMIFAWARAIA